jgi:murein DD-endopeptidase MepM/ murein hydrolase activator NlpD
MSRRPKARKAVLLLPVVVLLAILMAFNTSAKSPVYELRVDGQTLGLVDDADLAHRAAASILQRRIEKVEFQLVCINDIEVVEADNSRNPEIMQEEEVLRALERVLEFMAYAAMIEVNGNEVIALKTKQEAEQVLTEIRAMYESASNTAGQTALLDLRFNEDIRIVEKPVDLECIKCVEDAKQILLRGTDKLVLHTVTRGQSLWSIARDNNITVDSLRAANPDLRGDLINIGQQLNLAVAEPYVTVLSVERQTVTLNIAFRTEVTYDAQMWPWEMKVKTPGIYGKKEVTYEISYQNGREVSRETLSEVVLSEPRTQVVIQGSKVIPDMGTGQFAFPVVGQITSRFGPRAGGFHNGLDVAAPMGTPIHAADSGVVTFSGWRALYGNMVMIDHGGGKRVTVYGHCSELLVKVGDQVEKGQVIAKVGSTGRSTGPHVHFEVRVDGVPQDPAKYYPGLR